MVWPVASKTPESLHSEHAPETLGESKQLGVCRRLHHLRHSYVHDRRVAISASAGCLHACRSICGAGKYCCGCLHFGGAFHLGCSSGMEALERPMAKHVDHRRGASRRECSPCRCGAAESVWSMLKPPFPQLQWLLLPKNCSFEPHCLRFLLGYSILSPSRGHMSERFSGRRSSSPAPMRFTLHSGS